MSKTVITSAELADAAIRILFDFMQSMESDEKNIKKWSGGGLTSPKGRVAWAELQYLRVVGIEFGIFSSLPPEIYKPVADGFRNRLKLIQQDVAEHGDEFLKLYDNSVSRAREYGPILADASDGTALLKIGDVFANHCGLARDLRSSTQVVVHLVGAQLAICDLFSKIQNDHTLVR